MAFENTGHVRLEVVPAMKTDTGTTIKVTRPQDVLQIHDVEELKAQLAHYAVPAIRLVVRPDTPVARKYYVEYVRSALRYYCTKFGVTIPHWLENDDFYHKLDDDTKQELFGTTKLSKREFRPLKSIPHDAEPV